MPKKDKSQSDLWSRHQDLLCAATLACMRLKVVDRLLEDEVQNPSLNHNEILECLSVVASDAVCGLERALDKQ